MNHGQAQKIASEVSMQTTYLARIGMKHIYGDREDSSLFQVATQKVLLDDYVIVTTD